MYRYFKAIVFFLFGAVIVGGGLLGQAQGQQGSAIVPLLDSIAAPPTGPATADTYIFLDPQRPQQLLAELRSHIEVRDNDFMRWMRYADTFKQQQQLEDGQHKYARPVWILAVLFCLFLAIALIRLFFPTDFFNIIHGYYNERVFLQISKEDSMVTSWPYIFLYLIFSGALGLFIVLMESSFTYQYVLTLENFVKTSLVVGLLFILKILFIRFLSFVFQIAAIVREYIAVLYLVYFNSMLFLMPFLLLITFTSSAYFKIILILFTIAVVMLFAYRFLRVALGLFGHQRFSVFYLILYLCVLEIAPVLILVRTLSN